MPRYMLTHRHGPNECRIAFAAWAGFDSPLRHEPAAASCGSRAGRTEEHRVWWEIEADSPAAALRLLPPYVAQRTEASEAGEVTIP